MKRLLLFTPFLLAAKSAHNDFLEEGRWESVFQVETATIDGKKSNKPAAPIYQPSRCIQQAETAPMTFFTYSDSQDCKTTAVKAEKGKVTLSRICHPPAMPTAYFTAKGHYDSHHYWLNFVMWNKFDGGKMALKGHIKGSYQDLCSAHETTIPLSVNP
ncbi:DUF3617 family protein [Zymomonas sp.]|uniref:DUF3617 domain-containing protein n=1 Tax=Zymomonas sp. TaxID=2068624 RepID=UPI0025F84042|nr:DUF3617 family protein [Zymomonas sp.]MCA1956876.1 DUF3617 family protein [Zymomonas sp.]